MKPLTVDDAKVSIQIRVPITLRNRLVVKATERDQSLNQYVNEVLEKAKK